MTHTGADGEAITFTGRNTRDVRDFVNGGIEFIDTWFMTKSQAGPTDLQAWYYVRGTKDPKPGWEGARAAVFDPRVEEWLPVFVGDAVVREGSGYAVRRP